MSPACASLQSPDDWNGCTRLRFSLVLIICTSCNTATPSRDDYKFVEMIGQKQLSTIMSCNLIGHPYITLERQCYIYKWLDT